MDQTPNLKMPYILPSQAQKHVTHNDALRLLDAIVHLSVRSRQEMNVPTAPIAGDRYIVASPASGEWAGKENLIATFVDGYWMFVTPGKGWTAYIENEDRLKLYDGSQWKGVSSTPSELTLSLLGVDATPDAINRFAISSEASLFNNAGGGHQIKINKQSASDTASLLFQSNWTGHAEMGLNGDKNFSIKVGDDAGAWREAIKVDGATGNVAVGSAWPQTKLDVDGPIRPASYTLATMPSAGEHGAGAIIFVSDASSGPQLAYSDGSAWRDMRAGAPIV